MRQSKGVLGGTFDPIHNGHLAIAEYLSNNTDLAEIHFIPCLSPPHRPSPQASPRQRLEMVELAISGHSNWIANDIDFQRPAPSYMVDTLQILQEKEPKTLWYLILGMDAFAHFNQWKQWEKILNLAHLIVINRPGFQLLEGAWIKNPKISIKTMPPSSISATTIRQQSPANWQANLPPSVLQYIRRNHLYQNR